MADSHYDPTIRSLIDSAAERLETTMARELPMLAGRVLPWLRGLSRTGRLADYFVHPRRFPMLLLPWWASEATGEPPDLGFHAAVAYSTINAYYFVRLVDDLVDRRGEPDLAVLPVTAFFHTECLTPYLPHFPADSAFWSYYRSTWLAATDAAADELAGPAADLPAFGERAARRLGPATIPMVAVLLQANRPDRIPAWRRFTLALGRLEQLLDDLSDWQHDQERQLGNLLLAEGMTRRAKGEPVAMWVLREGLLWAIETAERWLGELAPMAAALESPGAGRFVEDRRAMVGAIRAAVAPSARDLGALAAAFREPPD